MHRAQGCGFLLIKATMQNYGLKIREIRLKLGLSQAKLAELLSDIGLNRDHINSYEHSRARVTAEVWERVKELSQSLQIRSKNEEPRRP